MEGLKLEFPTVEDSALADLEILEVLPADQMADLVAKLESETPVGAPEQRKPVTPAEAEQQKRILAFQASRSTLKDRSGCTIDTG